MNRYITRLPAATKSIVNFKLKIFNLKFTMLENLCGCDSFFRVILYLEKMDLANVNLEGANLKCANLAECNLYRANLKNANLLLANLENAHMVHTNLETAVLIGTNLKHARIPDLMLQGATYNDTTIFSDFLEAMEKDKLGMVFTYNFPLEQVKDSDS